MSTFSQVCKTYTFSDPPLLSFKKCTDQKKFHENYKHLAKILKVYGESTFFAATPSRKCISGLNGDI